jgi:hypothetical protein
MSVSSLSLFGVWRDYWGMWSALVEPNIAPLDAAGCYYPRLILLPEVSQQTVPASGKVEYNFRLPAGSILWGMFAPKPSVDWTVQLTDVTLGHQFFQEPINVSQLFTNGPQVGEMPAVTLFATPHPVVGDGLFTFEAWAEPASTVLMMIGSAEVSDCPVK